MNSKIIKRISMIFFLIPLIQINNIHVFAEEVTSKGANFSITPNYPENQLPGTTGYFNLLTKPGENQKLSITVNNYSDKKNTIYAKVARATTSDGGVISYKEFDKEYEGENLDFNELVTIHEEKIEIPSQGSKDLVVEVKTPKEPIKGVVLGGVHFYQKSESIKKSEKAVTNTFSYSMPIMIREKEEKVNNKLELISVTPNLRNMHPFIEAKIKNSAPTIVENMIIDGRIYNTKNNEEYYVRKEDAYQIAPDSTLNFGFDLQDGAFQPGEYKLILNVVADDQEYEFEKIFTIDKNSSKEFNESAAYIETKESPLIWWLISGLVALCIISGTVIYINKNSNKKIKRKIKKK